MPDSVGPILDSPETTRPGAAASPDRHAGHRQAPARQLSASVNAASSTSTSRTTRRGSATSGGTGAAPRRDRRPARRRNGRRDHLGRRRRRISSRRQAASCSQGAAAVWSDSDRGAACRAHYAGASRIPRFDFVDTFDAGRHVPPGRGGRQRSARAAPRRRRPQRPSLPRVADHGPRPLPRSSLQRRRSPARPRPPRWCSPASAPRPRAAHHARPALALDGAAPLTAAAALPKQGVLVSNQSLAGISLGDTEATVKKLWGGHFSRCGAARPRPGSTSTRRRPTRSARASSS